MFQQSTQKLEHGAELTDCFGTGMDRPTVGTISEGGGSLTHIPFGNIPIVFHQECIALYWTSMHVVLLLMYRSVSCYWPPNCTTANTHPYTLNSMQLNMRARTAPLTLCLMLGRPRILLPLRAIFTECRKSTRRRKATVSFLALLRMSPPSTQAGDISSRFTTSTRDDWGQMGAFFCKSH